MKSTLFVLLLAGMALGQTQGSISIMGLPKDSVVCTLGVDDRYGECDDGHGGHAALPIACDADGVSHCHIPRALPFSTRELSVLPLVEPERPQTFAEICSWQWDGAKPICVDARVDVPAIRQEQLIGWVAGDAWAGSYVVNDAVEECSDHGGRWFIVRSGYWECRKKTWTCADKSRVLLVSENGKDHHCIKF
jgi:hypothetical protein